MAIMRGARRGSKLERVPSKLQRQCYFGFRMYSNPLMAPERVCFGASDRQVHLMFSQPTGRTDPSASPANVVRARVQPILSAALSAEITASCGRSLPDAHGIWC